MAVVDADRRRCLRFGWSRRRATTGRSREDRVAQVDREAAGRLVDQGDLERVRLGVRPRRRWPGAAGVRRPAACRRRSGGRRRRRSRTVEPSACSDRRGPAIRKSPVPVVGYSSATGSPTRFENPREAARHEVAVGRGPRRVPARSARCAECAVLVDAQDVADPLVAEVELAGLRRSQVDRHLRQSPAMARASSPSVYRPGRMRYSGSVSGPAARGARGRDGRHRDGRPSPGAGRGPRHGSRRPGRRHGAWVTDTWRGRVEVDPEAARRPSSPELEPADVGMAAVLLRAGCTAPSAR